MKKILFLLSTILVMISCKEEPKNYISFSGTITDKNSDSIMIFNRKAKFKKIIKVDENGTFKDTFNLKEPTFLTLFDGKEYGMLYLRNGDDVTMTLDTKLFDETIKFKGKGASESNFLARKALIIENFEQDDSLFLKPQEEFDQRIREFNLNVLNELQETESNDTIFINQQDKDITSFKKYINKTYEDKKYIITQLKKGTPTPDFTQPYENYDGSKTSLKDLRGKYVYIDIWATWCGYCKQEMPYLKKLAEQYKDKNITFLGISVDKNNKHDKWKEVVKEKNLPGIQLFYNQDKDFMEKYRVSGVPRFILLDPQGNIINAEAPKASDPKITELLNSLNI